VLSVPWSLARLDAHDPLDAAAALFAHAVFDSLYALDAKQQPYAALADAMPEQSGDETIVRLRPGLVTARGVALDGRDLVHSVERARKAGSHARLEAVGRPKRHARDPLAVLFPTGDVEAVARALASPLLALVPRSFDPRRPDGTGAFAARFSAGELVLEQNLRAARGPAYLDVVRVRAAPDLRASLRAFESANDDIGWLGAGLHGQRREAVGFDLGAAALVVLVASRELGPEGRPGALQSLVDAVPRERLAHLGLGELPAGRGGAGLTGASVELCVDAAEPHLVEIADALASALGSTETRVSVRRLGANALVERRARPGRALFLHALRLHGASTVEVLTSLAELDDPLRAKEIARRPMRGARAASVRSLASELRVAVVGELGIRGAAAPDLVLARGDASAWDLGASYRKRKR
jgi:peptide/nickel transport system substrate-binding protein